MKAQNNTVKVDTKHLELCNNCFKHMSINVESEFGYMYKCLNCGYSELETSAIRKLKAIKDLLKWYVSDPRKDDLYIECKNAIEEIIDE